MGLPEKKNELFTISSTSKLFEDGALLEVLDEGAASAMVN